jgi:ABC-type uncharacterized transport system substrate-binding protein
MADCCIRLGLGLLSVLLAGATSAAAHPHVYVEMTTAVTTQADGLVKGVKVSWAFDDAYAAVALEGMDANGDGTYSAEELALLTKENLESIADYGFFTFLRQNNAALKIAGPGPAVQTYENGKLRLTYELLLATPADPKAGAIQIKFHDPEFYIAFDYAKSNPASLDGQLPPGCAIDLKPPPTGEEIEAKRAYLADKPVGWKPEQEEDFGALFAQALMVTCAS